MFARSRKRRHIAHFADYFQTGRRDDACRRKEESARDALSRLFIKRSCCHGLAALGALAEFEGRRVAADAAAPMPAERRQHDAAITGLGFRLAI